MGDLCEGEVLLVVNVWENVMCCVWLFDILTGKLLYVAANVENSIVFNNYLKTGGSTNIISLMKKFCINTK